MHEKTHESESSKTTEDVYPSDDFANVSEPTIQTVIYNCGKSEFSNKDKEKLNLHIDNDHKPNTTHDATRIEKDVSIEGIQDLDDALKNCTLCNYKTTAHDGLKVHMETKHSEATRKQRDIFTSDVCSEIFSTKQAIEEHQLIHSTVELQCDECEFKARSSVEFG